MNTINRFLQPVKPVLLFSITVLALLSLSRLGLSLWQNERLLSQPEWYLTLLQGVRIDVATLGWILVIPSLILFLFSPVSRGGRLIWRLMQFYLLLTLILIVYMELVTPTFMEEYQLRPNRLFIEYLIYPKEVFSMLVEGYKLTILLVMTGLIATVVIGFRWIRWIGVPQQPANFLHRAVLTVLMVTLCVIAARSTFGHRPINPAMVAYANDPLVNDLTLNSTYSLLFAARNMSAEMNAEKFYGKLPADVIIHTIRETSGIQEDIIDESIPTLHHFTPSRQPDRPVNVVILLQESLGARFVGKLGGADLTPNLDQLMEQHWNFTRFYATGTRSVRGIEAVVSGFSPSPSRSVVKLSKSQTGFFTIAELLKRNGYHTQFIYGGEAHFDNMKSFFLGNGIDDIVDLDRFEQPEFVGSWGASDGDLYNEAHAQFSKLHAQNKPFFSLVFTSTNHTPFEYPAGHIVPDGEPQTRENAIRYSDWALGQFFDKARQSDYWEDTVFWVIADHDARIYENSILPIRSFHIPSVIVGKDIKARVDDRLASSMDVVPTLLSLTGIAGLIPTISNDLTREVPVNQLHDRMQFDKNFGYLKNDKLIVMQPEKDPVAFLVKDDELIGQAPLSDADIIEARTNALWANYAYQKQIYRLPDTEKIPARDRKSQDPAESQSSAPMK